jgi:hypothetical protein
MSPLGEFRMSLFRICLWGALAAGVLGAADVPKLCELLPPGNNFTIPYLYNPIRSRGFADLLPKVTACLQPAQCLAGMGQLIRGAVQGEGLRAVISVYKSPEESREAVSRYGGQPNSRDYGDAAIVGVSATVSEVRFAWGAYNVEVYGYGAYASQVVPLARYIDTGIKRLSPSATCAAPGGETKTEIIRPDRPEGKGPGAPAVPRTGTAALGKAAACFPNDPSAALLDAARHRAMAAAAPKEALQQVLNTRIRTIHGCSRVSPDRWSSLYATISVAVAKRFRDARCFANDAAAINPDWNFHKNQRPAFNSPDSLIFKTDQAVQCMPEQDRAVFFGEVAAAIAAALEE